jgi:hypothetical protein
VAAMPMFDIQNRKARCRLACGQIDVSIKVHL